jgi:hypothetical protein
VSTWNWSTDAEREARKLKLRSTPPDSAAAAEFEAHLWAETDRSLARDPSRWRTVSASLPGGSTLTRGAHLPDDAEADDRRDS